MIFPNGVFNSILQYSCVSEAAFAADGLSQVRFAGAGDDRSPFHPLDDELGYAHAAGDGERFFSKVYQDDADLSSVVGIHGPGAVDDAYAVLGRQTAPRPNLYLVALGNSCLENPPGSRTMSSLLAAQTSSPLEPSVW